MTKKAGEERSRLRGSHFAASDKQADQKNFWPHVSMLHIIHQQTE